MATRKIVRIDEERCDGCGQCVPNCAEGALQVIDGKVRLVSDNYCDGLGACLGHCPQDALIIEEREAPEFDVDAVEHHLQKRQEAEKKLPIPPSHAGCPSSRIMHLKPAEPVGTKADAAARSESMLSHWPVQLKLVPVNAPYFQNSDLLVVADCVPFAYPNLHQDFLKGRAVVVGCPKLDDIRFYREKLTEILKKNEIKSVTVPFMEVPCCFGLVKATEDALKDSEKKIPITKVKIGVRGEAKKERD